MKVILKADIKGVGKKNEVINASDGYARNFLFPKNLAVEANAENMSKLQAQKDAQAAADKFTKRRDDLVLNMHAVARDKNINPATKAGMIGLIAREIGLQPKDYDAENNVLNVADTKGNMMTFDFNEQLGEKDQATIDKINAQIGTEGARKSYYESRAKSSSGSGTKQNKIKITDIKNDPRFKNVLQDTADSYTSDITDSLSDLNESARRDLYNMLNEGEDKVRTAYGTVYKALQDEFGGRFGNKEPQSTIEEKVNLTDIWSNM
jgi:hypothetical protein